MERVQPTILLPLFPVYQRDYEASILNTVHDIIQRSNLGDMLVRFEVSVSEDPKFPDVSLLRYKITLNIDEEVWVEATFGSDGRYWWISSSSKTSVGSVVHNYDLTCDEYKQVQVTLEGLGRFLTDRANAMKHKASLMADELTALNGKISLIQLAAQGITRTGLPD